MAICKRMALTVGLAMAIWVGAAGGAQAQKLEIVLKDGLWGGAIGALLGAAHILMMEDPQGEEYRIVTGAGIGIILGVGFGFIEASGALATYDNENGRLLVGIPTPQILQTPAGREVRITLLEAPF